MLKKVRGNLWFYNDIMKLLLEVTLKQKQQEI
jgi:hypothetical protein